MWVLWILFPVAMVWAIAAFIKLTGLQFFGCWYSFPLYITCSTVAIFSLVVGSIKAIMGLMLKE